MTLFGEVKKECEMLFHIDPNNTENQFKSVCNVIERRLKVLEDKVLKKKNNSPDLEYLEKI